MVQGRERVGEQVQRREAAHGVEALVAKRQAHRVAAHVADARVFARRRIAHRAGQHRRRGVDADDEPGLADHPPEVAGEVAGAAGDVEHSVAGDEAEQQTGDSMLVGHARAQQALGHAAEGRAPPALVDHRDDAGEHEVLCDPGRGRIALGAQ